jgi:hypothetical protein
MITEINRLLKTKQDKKTSKKQEPVKSNMNDYTDLMKKALNTPLPVK